MVKLLLMLAFCSVAAAAQTPSAREYKEAGDRRVAEERLIEAADAYEQALTMDRNAFSADERARMAVYISWDNRLERAIEELKLVLKQHPTHIESRVHLARVYSWAGALRKSVEEADKALRISRNRDALLVKADALEWQGHFRKAIPIYRDVLARDGGFAAGLGLSHSLLSGGNVAGAAEIARRLVPDSPRQKTQLGELFDAIDDIKRPRVDLRHNYYQDTDGNRQHRYSFTHGVGFANHSVELGLRRMDNRGRTERTRTESAWLNISSNLTEGVKLGGGVGVSQLEAAERHRLMTGQLRLDLAVSNGRAGISAVTDVLADTVELVGNRVRANSYSGYLSKPWGDRFSVQGTYSYRDFSDGNHAHDVQAAPQIAVLLFPRVAVGYRFRFLDFRGQSGSGYFDPDRFRSHRVFISLSMEQDRFYTYLDIFAGRQSFVRNAYPSEDWIAGGAASVGFRPVRTLAIEINGEGGDFAASSVAGFRYFVLGSRVAYRF